MAAVSAASVGTAENTHPDVLLALGRERRQAGLARRGVRRRSEAVDVGQGRGRAGAEEDELDGFVLGGVGDLE